MPDAPPCQDNALTWYMSSGTHRPPPEPSHHTPAGQSQYVVAPAEGRRVQLGQPEHQAAELAHQRTSGCPGGPGGRGARPAGRICCARTRRSCLEAPLAPPWQWAQALNLPANCRHEVSVEEPWRVGMLADVNERCGRRCGGSIEELEPGLRVCITGAGRRILAFWEALACQKNCVVRTTRTRDITDI
jgi:hypothetical protein